MLTNACLRASGALRFAAANVSCGASILQGLGSPLHGIPPFRIPEREVDRAAQSFPLWNGSLKALGVSRWKRPARDSFSPMEGVRIDEELARKGPCGRPPVWGNPSRVQISLPPPCSEEARHRRGHRLERSWRTATTAGDRLSWVRFPLLPPFSSCAHVDRLKLNRCLRDHLCYALPGRRQRPHDRGLRIL